jgi:hypothetical protein
MDDDYPYLVSGQVEKVHYMLSPIVRQLSNIVMARSENEAEEKFEAYYSSLSREYDVSYYVRNVTVHPTIR